MEEDVQASTDSRRIILDYCSVYEYIYPCEEIVLNAAWSGSRAIVQGSHGSICEPRVIYIWRGGLPQDSWGRKRALEAVKSGHKCR